MDQNQYQINICHLYPDVLNLYGDTGNILCMANRLRWRGIACNVTMLGVGEIAFVGLRYLLYGRWPGLRAGSAAEGCRRVQKSEIQTAIDEEKVLLAICGGYQILGNYYRTWEGKEYAFMGCLNLHTLGHKERMIGNFMFDCQDTEAGAVVGFENHSGKTYLGDGVEPLGRVISGYGNNGEDGTEGARYKNVFATYSHGPILPKNPMFCDLLLKKALCRKYGEIVLDQLDDTFENNAHDYMVKRLTVKG